MAQASSNLNSSNNQSDFRSLSSCCYYYCSTDHVDLLAEANERVVLLCQILKGSLSETALTTVVDKAKSKARRSLSLTSLPTLFVNSWIKTTLTFFTTVLQPIANELFYKQEASTIVNATADSNPVQVAASTTRLIPLLVCFPKRNYEHFSADL